jgi:hypothetical protein
MAESSHNQLLPKDYAAKWDFMYQLLKDYLSNNKHNNSHVDVCLVYKGQKLGFWVNAQRGNFRKRKKGQLATSSDVMSDQRIARLNEIGFVWEKMKQPPASAVARGQQQHTTTIDDWSRITKPSSSKTTTTTTTCEEMKQPPTSVVVAREQQQQHHTTIDDGKASHDDSGKPHASALTPTAGGDDSKPQPTTNDRLDEKIIIIDAD